MFKAAINFSMSVHMEQLTFHSAELKYKELASTCALGLLGSCAWLNHGRILICVTATSIQFLLNVLLNTLR